MTAELATIIVALITVLGTITNTIITSVNNRNIKKTKDKLESINLIKAEFQKEIEKKMALSEKADEEIKKMIKDLSKRVDCNDIDVVRRSISSFDQVCRLDEKHDSIPLHSYNTAFIDIDKWAKYHKKYSELNGEINAAVENIKEHYKKAKFE